MAARRIEFEDWIPYRPGLEQTDEVGTIALATGLTIHDVAHRLLKFWAWAGQHTADGFIAGMTVQKLALLHGPSLEFWQAALTTRWFRAQRGGVLIVNADRWITGAAKARLVERKRERERKRAQRDNGGTMAGQSEDNGGTMAGREPGHTPGQNPDALARARSPSLSSSSNLDPKDQESSSDSSRKQGRALRRVPDDFELTGELRSFAEERGLVGAALADEWQSFRDHEFKTPRVNWPGCWRTWVKNWQRFGGGVRSLGNGSGLIHRPQTAAARSFDALAEVLEEDEQR